MAAYPTDKLNKSQLNPHWSTFAQLGVLACVPLSMVCRPRNARVSLVLHS